MMKEKRDPGLDVVVACCHTFFHDDDIHFSHNLIALWQELAAISV